MVDYLEYRTLISIPSRIKGLIRVAIRFDFYDRIGGHLFPLRKFKLGDRGSKAPLGGVPWRDARFSHEQLEDYVSHGHALGWAIPPDMLIADVEVATAKGHDEDGRETLRRLESSYPCLATAPRTVSPIGGTHLYLRVPANMSLRKKHPEFPGIEWLAHGHYVVAAGSPHWQGGRYELC